MMTAYRMPTKDAPVSRWIPVVVVRRWTVGGWPVALVRRPDGLTETVCGSYLRDVRPAR